MSQIVAIVGRPNVGKSTLFNRLLGRRHAIVDEFSGVTRDRQYGTTEWNGRTFTVVDTGGFVHGSDDIFEGEIRRQVQIAIDEAAVIVFMVDILSGITDLDNAVARMLRKTKKPILLVANKADNNERHMEAMEFYGLGLGEVHPVSSVTGSGTGDFLDELVKTLPEDRDEDGALDADAIPRLAVVGRPNAGKSSFVNTLLGVERNIVTDIAGTTRDSIDTHFKGFGHEFVIVDTAGIRKKSKVHEDLEFYSVMRALRAIENCEICVIMIDAEQGFSAQDVSLFHLAEKNGKGVVILMNKWDLIEKETNTSKMVESLVRDKIAPFSDVPVIFISVHEKQRTVKALDIIADVHKRRATKIKTAVLNEFFLPLVNRQPPPSFRGHATNIKFVTQLPTAVPSFAFYSNRPKAIKEPYRRFLENSLRNEFDLTGVPVRLYMRQK